MRDKLKDIIIQNIQKDKRKKNEKNCFFYFAFFSKSVFQPKPSSIPPFSPRRLGRSGSTFFYSYFGPIGVCIFFYHKISFVSDLGAFRKFISSKKQAF
jgi:hypothetical protein